MNLISEYYHFNKLVLPDEWCLFQNQINTIHIYYVVKNFIKIIVCLLKLRTHVNVK